MPWLRWLGVVSVASLLATLPVPTRADLPAPVVTNAAGAPALMAQAPRTVDALSGRLQEWIDERLQRARDGHPETIEVPLTLLADRDGSGTAQYVLGPGYGSVQVRVEPVLGTDVELAPPAARNQIFSVQGWFTGRDFLVQDRSGTGSVSSYELQVVSARRSRGEVDEFFRIIQDTAPTGTAEGQPTSSVETPEPPQTPAPEVTPEPVEATPEEPVAPTPEVVPEPTPPVEPEVAVAPVEIPPVVTPPVEIPPVVTPPVEIPPVVTPPVETPPVETPPVVTPPVETPTAETPPAETPPADQTVAMAATPSLAVRGNPSIEGSTAHLALTVGGAGDTVNLAYTIEGPHGSRMGQVQAERAADGSYSVDVPLADPVTACDGTWLYLIDTGSGASTESALDLSWDTGC